MKNFEIIGKYMVNGKMVDCLADTPTAIGCWCVCGNEERAQQRVAELQAKGIDARYEERIQGTAWYDDSNWIG